MSHTYIHVTYIYLRERQVWEFVCEKLSKSEKMKKKRIKIKINYKKKEKKIQVHYKRIPHDLEVTKPFKSKKDRSPGDRVAHKVLLFDQVQHTAISIYNSPPQTYTVIPAAIIQRADTDYLLFKQSFSTYCHPSTLPCLPPLSKFNTLPPTTNFKQSPTLPYLTPLFKFNALTPTTFQTTLHLQAVTQTY